MEGRMRTFEKKTSDLDEQLAALQTQLDKEKEEKQEAKDKEQRCHSQIVTLLKEKEVSERKLFFETNRKKKLLQD